MEQLNKYLLLGLSALFLAGCGVKGSPMPPLTPTPLGRGEPTYTEATRKSKQKTRTYKDEDAEEAPSNEGSGL